MGLYKELNIIIADYVGYKEDPTSDWLDLECADKVLYDNIVNECTHHIKDSWPLDKLSKDAQWCINEWENQQRQYRLWEARRENSKFSNR